MLRGVGLIRFAPRPLDGEPRASRSGTALTTNDFRIDVITTPVLGSSRTIGLGGAFTAVGEGIDAVPFNPAGYAARFPFEHDYYEYELTGGLQLGGVFSDLDYFLNGDDAEDDQQVRSFYGVAFGGRLQFGQLGVGGSYELEILDVPLEAPTDRPVSADFSRLRVGAGYNLLEGQLALGGGLHLAGMSLRQGLVELVRFSGAGVEVGAALRLVGRPWRAGLMFRSRSRHR